MNAYSSDEKKLLGHNLISILEYTRVVLRIWNTLVKDHECTTISEILQFAKNSISEIYVKRSEHCGRFLPYRVLQAKNIKEIKYVYSDIYNKMGRPDLEPLLESYPNLRSAKMLLDLLND